MQKTALLQMTRQSTHLLVLTTCSSCSLALWSQAICRNPSFHTYGALSAGGTVKLKLRERAKSGKTASDYGESGRSRQDRAREQPSRMRLSPNVAGTPFAESAAKKFRKLVSPIDRGGGMNRKEFIADERGTRVQRRFVAAREAQLHRQEIKPSRPPLPKFKQMKHIASLNSVSLSQRASAVEAMVDHAAFDSFNLLPQVLEALKTDALGDMHTITPTPIQSLAIPVLMDRKHLGNKDDILTGKGLVSFLLAAETGSGKTLAYLLPILDNLKRKEAIRRVQNEEKDLKEAEERAARAKQNEIFDLEEPALVKRDVRAGKPLAVILLPTSELVVQVGQLTKALSHLIKFRSELISREFSVNVIRSRLFSRPLDVLISTPHLLESISTADPNVLSLASHLVVDEADSLFDRSFSPITSTIIERCTGLEKLILCSATIPKSLDTYLQRHYPTMKRLVTPNLHAIPRRVQLSLIEVEKDPYKGNKDLACADTLNNIAKDNTEPGYFKRVVVFVNERETTASLAAYLRSKGFNAIDINRDTSTRRFLEEFTGPKEETSIATGRRDQLKVLVTTDIASRGIDTKTVKNVVLYDVPFSSIDFIHRLGRTGRMGRRGKATVLVDKNSNMAWVREIKKSMFIGKSLI